MLNSIGPLALFGLAISTLAFVGDSKAGPICPAPPPNLGRQAATPDMPIESQIANFTYRSQVYPVDIRSAFARHGSSEACVRYEATSRATATIEKFYWPLPNIEIELERFEPKQTISYVVTGSPPEFDETWLYAFLNSAVKSKAYQFKKHSELQRQPRLALPTADGSRFRVAAIDLAQVKIPLDKPEEFSLVGANFSDGQDNEITASSKAVWDGKQPRITIALDRTNEKTVVFAPVTYALYKANNLSVFLSLIREFKNAPIDFAGTSFVVDRTIAPENFADTRALYLVDQPVTLVTATGRACFSSPIYSPVPIPPELLRCGLF